MDSKKSVILFLVLSILGGVSFFLFLQPKEIHRLVLASKGLELYENEKGAYSFEYPKWLSVSTYDITDELVNVSLYPPISKTSGGLGGASFIVTEMDKKENYYPDPDHTLVKTEKVLSNGIEWTVSYYDYSHSKADREQPYFKDFYFIKDGLKYSFQIFTNEHFESIRPDIGIIPLSLKFTK